MFGKSYICRIIRKSASFYLRTDLKNGNEIFELIEDTKADGLIDMNNFTLSKNNLAWFAFDTIAQEIYQEMEVASEF